VRKQRVAAVLKGMAKRDKWGVKIKLVRKMVDPTPFVRRAGGTAKRQGSA